MGNVLKLTKQAKPIARSSMATHMKCTEADQVTDSEKEKRRTWKKEREKRTTTTKIHCHKNVKISKEII